MELSNSASELGPPTGFPFEPTLVDNKVNSKYPGGGASGPFGSPILTRNEWESGDEAGFQHIIFDNIYILDITGYPAAIWPSNAKNPHVFLWQNVDLLENKASWNALQADMAPPPKTSLLHFFLIPASSNCQSTKHPLTTPWLSGKKRKNMFQFHSQSLWGDLTSHMYTR